MDVFLTANEIQRRAREAGLTRKELCERAGIDQSTWTRLKARQLKSNQFKMSLDMYRRVSQILAEAEMSRDLAAAQ